MGFGSGSGLGSARHNTNLFAAGTNLATAWLAPFCFTASISCSSKFVAEKTHSKPRPIKAALVDSDYRLTDVKLLLSFTAVYRLDSKPSFNPSNYFSYVFQSIIGQLILIFQLAN